jgi:hypothetical protein
LRKPGIERIMSVMDWTTPSYDEIKMDAEIGSYQQDGDHDNVPIVREREDTSAAE